jgi:NADPH:quinone reductase-like Zn-dependent oxidoreductase
MRAIVHEKFGPPDVLEVREVERPPLTDDGVLVRVHASSVNPFDWHLLTGLPYLARLGAGFRKPKTQRLGADFAGTVEAVGKDRTHFQPGDEVFGVRNGAFGEYVVARKSIAPKPANVPFEDAATIPIAGVTALQALRNKGGVEAGQKVLINGASGGVGTFAVQIAKALGAEVTAVCSTRNVEQARAIGADRVIDYTDEDFMQDGTRYDLLIDIAGDRPWSQIKSVLHDDGTSVVVGGPKTNRLFGRLGKSIVERVISIPGSRRLVTPFLASMNPDDLAFLGGLLEAGSVKPVIERRYQLQEVPEALRYIGEGHARGKLAVTVRQ